ncbi:MAG: hypothetical protein KAR76_04045 [Methanosarcinales archaeon]|nr:hypothetical protein [Methanosarcinales archaeon]
MIKRIGTPIVLVSLLTFVLVETNILTTGIIITIGLNVAMLLVVIQILALLLGIKRSLGIFNKMEQSPLYSPVREGFIHSQKEEQ